MSNRPFRYSASYNRSIVDMLGIIETNGDKPVLSARPVSSRRRENGQASRR